MLTSKNAIVFGGTGFIGRYVVRRLADLGYTVRIPTRNPLPLLSCARPGSWAR